MMGKLRIVVCIFFAVSCACFGASKTGGYRKARSRSRLHHGGFQHREVNRNIGESRRVAFRITDIRYVPRISGVFEDQRSDVTERLGSSELLDVEKKRKNRIDRIRSELRRFFLLWKSERR